MKQLDRNQPYAQVFGDNEGRAYEQDGVYFRGNGEEWFPADAPPTPPDAAKPAPTKKSMSKTAPEPAPAPAAEDAQLQVQLADKA